MTVLILSDYSSGNGKNLILAAPHILRGDIIAAPVVDENMVLHGIVTVDDVVGDCISQEAPKMVVEPALK